MLYPEADKTLRRVGLPLLYAFILIFWGSKSYASEPEDSLSYILDDIEIIGTKTVPLSVGGSMTLPRERLLTESRAFGEADALKLISRQSGVSTAGDYGSGLFIDGNLPSHVLYRIDGAPVFFPYRFGGLFSTFNSGHFSSTSFERGIHKASMPSRLGAKIDFSTGSSMPVSLSGLANVGMMSSSLSVKAPIGSKFYMALSGRISYVNQLYGWMLVGDDSKVKYDFADLNLTLGFSPGHAGLFKLNIFGNTDRLSYDDRNYAMDTHMDWRNGLVSLSWEKTGDIEMTHRLYATYFDNRLIFKMPQFGIKAPSSIGSFGASGEVGKLNLSENFNLSAGYEFNYYLMNIQEVIVTGFNRTETPGSSPLRPAEGRVYADGEWLFANGIRLDAGLSLALYGISRNFLRFAPDPRITLSVPAPKGSLNFHIGRYSQFLHQVGFSQIGLASDFWIGSKEGLEPETSYNLDVDYSGYIPDVGLYFTGTVYGRLFFNQAELMGEFLSILDSDYVGDNYIYNGKGYAAGVNLTVRKDIGHFTGTLGTGYGFTRRKFDGYDFYTRSRTEPGFSVSAEVNYRFNSHWSAGANFRYSTGRPYTPVTSLFIIGGNVMKNYGQPNSALLPAWHRLDLSATWSAWSGPSSHPLRHLVNFTLINAYGRRNPEFITYIIDFKTGMVKMKTVASIYRFFPSLSYTLVF